MIGQRAGVTFDANVDGYTQSLSQAIAMTNQYSQAADTLLGRIANLGGGLATAWVTKTAAITQANKTATAQAAAYQQKLSQLQTTSAALGDKTFPKLEKATLSLAKTFPIGIDQSVRQMKALQESGVTQIKTVEKMSVAYTKLGAATGEYGPELGKQMTELTRSMGNSLEAVEGMGDSLTTMTKKFGGTASGVLAFSKSIAPIAATVGMNQTQVMGLSTAFSRLGEDGFAAGNAINKVLIDLSRSVRDGTPELRTYAQVMGKSFEGLRKQFEDDPTSVIVDFTKVINEQGSDSIRIFEQLGLEGVRTAKAFQALSREGTLDQIISDSSKAFGNGSTERAAETAMGGVNDQILRLGETMSQTAAQSGKPFLAMLEAVLNRANDVAGAFNDLVSSPLMQKLGGGAQMVGGAVGSAVGLGMGVVGTAMNISLGRRALQFGARQAGNLLVGRAAGISANTGMAFDYDEAAAGTRMGRLGQRIAERGGLTSPSMMLATVPTGPDILRSAGRGAVSSVRGTVRTTRAIASMMAAAAANDMNDVMGSQYGSKLTSAQGQAYLASSRSAWEQVKGGNVTRGLDEFATATARAAKAAGTTTEAFGSLTRNTGSMLKASGYMLGTTAKSVGSAIGGTAYGAASMFGPPPLLAAGALAYGVYRRRESEKTQTETIRASVENPYQTWNEFAERAGFATKSISALGDAAAYATKQLLAEENKGEDDWKTLSPRELEAATKPDYKPALTLDESVSTRQAALNAFLANPNATNTERSQMVLDVASQRGTAGATDFIKAYQEFIDRFKSDPIQLLGSAIESSSMMRPGTDKPGLARLLDRLGFEGKEENAFKGQIAEQFTMWEAEDSKKGSRFASAEKDKRLEALYEQARGATSNEQRDYADVLEALTGIAKDDILAGLKKTGGSYTGYGQTPSPVKPAKTWTELLASQKDNPAAGSTIDANRLRGQYGPFVPPVDENLNNRKAADDRASKAIGATVNLTDALNFSNELTKSTGKTLKELVDSGAIESVGTSLNRLMAASEALPGDQQRAIKAGEALAANVLEQVGFSTGKAQMAIAQQIPTASLEQLPSLQAAMTAIQTNPGAVEQRTNMSPMQANLEKMRTGAMWAKTTLPEGADPTMRQNAIAEAVAAAEAARNQLRQISMQIRDTLKNMARQEDQFGTSRSRAWRDYNRQVQWAEADHARQMKWSKQDFHRQLAWSEEDYQISRKRAQESHDRSISRAEYDFNLNRLRAQENFARQMARAYADFAKSMLRAEEAYYVARSRAIEDHDKQLRYQIEDNAKAMYSPYERMMHNRVQDLQSVLGNLKEQNQYLLKQMEAVDQLKAMGMSQQTVDLLDLSNPENLQQTLRIANDATRNPALIQQANAAAAQRAAASQAYSTDNDNVGFRRSEEAYNTSMARLAEDHARQVRQANEDFQTQVVRQYEDFTITMVQSLEDHIRAISIANEDFGISMNQMADDYEKNTNRAIKTFNTQMSQANKSFDTAMENQKTSFTTSMADARADFLLQKGYMLEDLQTALTDVSGTYDSVIEAAAKYIATLPEDLREPLLEAFGQLRDDVETAMKDLDPVKLKATIIISDYKFAPGFQIDSPSRPKPGETKDGGGSDGHEYGEEDSGSTNQGGGWLDRAIGRDVSTPHNYGMRKHPVTGRWSMHTGVDLGLASGSPLYAPFDGYAKMNVDSPAWAGNSVVIKPGNGGAGVVFAHMRGFSRGSGAVRKGEKVGSVGSTGTSTGPHLHMEVLKSPYRPYSDAVSPYTYLALGGIATKQMDAKIAEAGYPEAVVPLNERGANYLADVMKRYVPTDEAKGARVAPYATKVIVNSSVTYDQSTKVLGPVTVEANDPNDFARQMAAKARRDKLVQPVGSRR